MMKEIGMIDRFISWLYTRRIWGKRCNEYDPDCPSCEAWATHDWIMHEGPDPNEKKWMAEMLDLYESGELETIKLTGKTDEEVLEILFKKPPTGIISTMTPEKLARALEYDGPISCGKE